MAMFIFPLRSKWYINGPYSSAIQNPSFPRTSASGSKETLVPPLPEPPKPSPVNLEAGRFGKPANAREVVGSRPEIGLPDGSVKRIVSR